MKSLQNITFIISALILSLSFSSFANESSDHQDGPCKKIMDACKNAKSDSKQKSSIYKECFQPLMNDQSVEGVSIDKADVAACKAKREALQSKKGK